MTWYSLIYFLKANIIWYNLILDIECSKTVLVQIYKFLKTYLTNSQESVGFVVAAKYFDIYYKIFISQIAETLESTLIRHRSDSLASDRYLIDVDPNAFAIWGIANMHVHYELHNARQR